MTYVRIECDGRERRYTRTNPVAGALRRARSTDFIGGSSLKKNEESKGESPLEQRVQYTAPLVSLMYNCTGLFSKI
jgi:hypothetical protein